MATCAVALATCTVVQDTACGRWLLWSNIYWDFFFLLLSVMWNLSKSCGGHFFFSFQNWYPIIIFLLCPRYNPSSSRDYSVSWDYLNNIYMSLKMKNTESISMIYLTLKFKSIYRKVLVWVIGEKKVRVTEYVGWITQQDSNDRDSGHFFLTSFLSTCLSRPDFAALLQIVSFFLFVSLCTFLSVNLCVNPTAPPDGYSQVQTWQT